MLQVLCLAATASAATKSLPAPLSEFYIKPNTHYHNCATLGKLRSTSDVIIKSLVTVTCVLNSILSSVAVLPRFYRQDHGGEVVIASFLFACGCKLMQLLYASIGPAPRDVLTKTMAGWANLESDPADKYFGMFQNGSMTAKDDLVRGKVADYIGAMLDEVALVPSTTIALNSVATGLVSSGHLKHGDHVLTTDQAR